MNEKIGNPDLDAIAAALDRLYVSERKRYVRMAGGRAFVPKRGKRPVPLTMEALSAHVQRQCAVGVYAGDRGSRFLCFDVDDGRRETAEAILSCLYECGVPEDKAHVSLSGGKGYHIDLFFDEEIPVAHLMQVYNFVLEQCGLDRHRVEFRPTGGMAIKLPLSVHWRTGAVCWFLDRHTWAPVDTPNYILDIQPWQACGFYEVLRRLAPE